MGCGGFGCRRWQGPHDELSSSLLSSAWQDFRRACCLSQRAFHSLLSSPAWLTTTRRCGCDPCPSFFGLGSWADQCRRLHSHGVVACFSYPISQSRSWSTKLLLSAQCYPGSFTVCKPTPNLKACRLTFWENRIQEPLDSEA